MRKNFEHDLVSSVCYLIEVNFFTSTVIRKDSDAKTGKRHRLSGVVRSVNHSVPPVLKDGTFSTIFEIWYAVRRQI